MNYKTATFFMLALAVTVGCQKTHKFTVKICDEKLSVEVYEVNPAGVDAEYLTDSTNFRKYVSRFDTEHEYIHYQCLGDSIYMVRVETGSKNCRWVTTEDSMQTVICDPDTLEQQVFSLNALKQKHRFE